MHPQRNLERQVDYLRRRLVEVESLAKRASQLLPHAFSSGGGSGGGSAPMVGYADGDIAARSGATLGTGTVARYATAGGTLVDADQSLTVYNTGPAISDGVLCVVQKDRDGTLLVGPLECEEEE